MEKMKAIYRDESVAQPITWLRNKSFGTGLEAEWARRLLDMVLDHPDAEMVAVPVSDGSTL